MDEKQEQTNSYYNYFSVKIDPKADANKVELEFVDVLYSPNLLTAFTDIVNPAFYKKIQITPKENGLNCILIKIDPSIYVFNAANIYFGSYPTKYENKHEKGQDFYFDLDTRKEYTNLVYKGRLTIDSKNSSFRIENKDQENCDLELSKIYTKLDFKKTTNDAAIREKRKLDEKNKK